MLFFFLSHILFLNSICDIILTCDTIISNSSCNFQFLQDIQQIVNDKGETLISHKHRTETVPDRNLTPWPPKYRLGALTTELREILGELGHLFTLQMQPRPGAMRGGCIHRLLFIRFIYVTRVLHTARISNVETQSIICVINNKKGRKF